MDGAKPDGGKALQAKQPAGSSDDAGGEGSAKPLSDDGPCDEADVEEQVERFYALLANIRALRRAYTPDDGGGARKRPRGSSQPPWRPAFRLEDFEEDATAASSARRAVKKERSPADGEEEKGADGPVAPSPSAMSQLPPRSGARRFGSDSKTV